MSTNDQWAREFEEVEEEKNLAAEKFTAAMFLLFSDASEHIANYVANWFAKYSVDGKITYKEARRNLTDSELRKFKSDLRKFNGTWAEKLLVRKRITRLDKLNAEFCNTVDNLYNEYLLDVDTFFNDLYLAQRKSTVALLKGDFWSDPPNLKVIWATDGKIYSDRIWANKTKLINELRNTVAKGLIRGDSFDTVSKELARKMNVSYSNAERLVKTEASYIGTASQAEVFRKMGVKQYQFVATLDRRTTPECRHFHKRVFPLSELEIGLNAPPLHVRCRSVIAPYDFDFPI